MFGWFKHLPPPRNDRTRLRVEILEDRSNPATFTVTSGATSGAGTLSDAIDKANNAPGADEIKFGIEGILNTWEELKITGELTITGLGVTKTVIKRDDSTAPTKRRIFNIDANVTMTNLTIKNGWVDGEDGGGIFQKQGTLQNNPNLLTLTGVRVESCSATPYLGEGGNGGGIAALGKLVMTDCVVTKCGAQGNGGGLFLRSAGATIKDSEITDNTATGEGGGIFFSWGKRNLTIEPLGYGRLTLDNTKVTLNSATTRGGGLTVRLGNSMSPGSGGAEVPDVLAEVKNNSHISDNRSDHEGGAVWNDATTVFKNSIIERNKGSADGYAVFNAATDDRGLVFDTCEIRQNEYVPPPPPPGGTTTVSVVAAAIWTSSPTGDGNIVIGTTKVTGNTGYGVRGKVSSNGLNIVDNSSTTSTGWVGSDSVS